MRRFLLAALLAIASTSPGHGAEAGAMTERVFESANAYFLVYSKECAPSFYAEAAFPGVAPNAVEVTLYADLFRTQYQRDCQKFYDAEIIHRHMAAIVYGPSAFPEGAAGLSAREAEIYGEELWIRMTVARNRCGTQALDELQLDNRALRAIRERARVGDLIAVGRGVIGTFERMQARGFSSFLTVAERCGMVRNAARSLLRTLIAEGRLGTNEVAL